MPTVTLITDLSANSVVNFSALAARKEKCARLPRKLCRPESSHQLIWEKAQTLVKENDSSRRLPRKFLLSLSEMAGQSRNIWLFGQETAPMPHSWLLRLLRSIPELRRYTLRAIVCLGRPDVVLEQRCRLEASQMLSPETIKSLTLSFSRLDTLIRMLLRELGEENVTILREPTTSAVPGRSVSRELRECLHLPEETPLHPQHALLLKSAEARAIWLTITDIRNSWPRCSDELLFTTLAECEKAHAWSTSNISSPEQRQAMLNACENSHDWISKNFFAGKPLFDVPCDVQEEWLPYTGLSDDCLLTFAEALPADGRKKLLRRLDIVHPLLTPDQKRMSDSLKRVRTKSNSAVEIPHQEERYTLSVVTLAYNQEKYISECIESVAAQQTNFRFKHIILDHASQDSTPDIISRYAEKHSHIVPVLMPIHLMNGENVRTLFSVADTPYVAVCDGDDYFTNPLKLQKQVDFLENHQECALCFHPVDVIYEDGSPSRVHSPEGMLPGGIRRFYTIKDLLFANIIQTNSVMYRWRFCEGLPDWFVCNLSPGDWYWHLLHAEIGLIGYLCDRMSVYRRHAASVYAIAEGHHVDLRKKHGLKELEMYHTINQHFKGRYYNELRRLVIGVLADFLQIYISMGDDRLLQTAAGLYPDFIRDFLSEIKSIKHGATENS